MNKKAVSPIIAVMLLAAVVVAAVGAYFIWYKAFQVGSQIEKGEIDTAGVNAGIEEGVDTNATFKVTYIYDENEKPLYTYMKICDSDGTPEYWVKMTEEGFELYKEWKEET